MEADADIRWKQRFINFELALEQFELFFEAPELNQRELQGLIKSFEYTYELSWLVLKDYLEYQGYSNIKGARDSFQLAFKVGLITDGETWMKMLKDRNLTSHTYNNRVANDVIMNIRNEYVILFRSLRKRMQELMS